MQEVGDRSAKIPGISVCAKTGTAEKYRIIDGQRVKLKDNSMFVCFAPRENPQIAIAVVVENSGFGATWAAPIASIMIEKYLNDTLREVSKKKSEELSAANIMPPYFIRLQYIEDSTRAFRWYEITKDSIYIKKYLKGGHNSPAQKQVEEPALKPVQKPTQQPAQKPDSPRTRITMILAEPKSYFPKKINFYYLS
jgi:penicillin-binding protein 2